VTGGTQAFDQADNVCNRLRAQLLHDPTALHLNGFFRGTEFTANLLIEHSLRYPHTYLSLSQRQGFEDGAIPAARIELDTSFSRSCEGCVNGSKQLARIEGLSQKIDCARFHGANRVGDIGVATDENNRHTFMPSRQHLLQVEATHVWHLEVEDNTGGTGVESLVEEFSRRRIGSDLSIV
jgi:hypothetical protein